MGPEVTQTHVDTLGVSGVYVDPLWRIEVTLGDLELELLRSWWVRRLDLVTHAGPAALVSPAADTRFGSSNTAEVAFKL